MADEYLRGAYESAISVLPEKIREILCAADASVKEKTREIRLRSGLPIQLFTGEGDFFIGVNRMPGYRGRVISKDELNDCFGAVCGYSVHTHTEEIRDGYVTLRGGHRVGICGSAVRNGSSVEGVRDITSLNIRIAREIKGCGEELAGILFKNGVTGTLIAGIPGCGKTTVVRDLARILAGGTLGRCVKVTVVDERGEIAGGGGYDLGYSCDVLAGYGKSEGIGIAVRALSPETVICDEIGGEDEAKTLCKAVNCGVKVIATAHASDIKELYSKENMRKLLKTGAFGKIVMMMCDGSVGGIDKIIDVER